MIISPGSQIMEKNLGAFDEELKGDRIPHYFSYPSCSKINTHTTKTTYEEFINNKLDVIFDKEEFKIRLVEYLNNAERPHNL